MDLGHTATVVESDESWLRQKFKLWHAHPWMFASGFAAGLAVFELAGSYSADIDLLRGKQAAVSRTQDESEAPIRG